MKNEQTVRLSSSLETLFSSVSTRECVCHERNLGKTLRLVFVSLFRLAEKQRVSCDECPSSSSMSCIRCSSTRTDLGYSSGNCKSVTCHSTGKNADLSVYLGQDDISSFGPCECSMPSCHACLIEGNPISLSLLSYNGHSSSFHEEDEKSDENGASISPCNSVLSSGIYSHNCCVHDTFLSKTNGSLLSFPCRTHSLGTPKTIELYDRTRRHKLKVSRSFFASKAAHRFSCSYSYLLNIRFSTWI